jgi:hypothetical protein
MFYYLITGSLANAMTKPKGLAVLGFVYVTELLDDRMTSSEVSLL